MYAMRKTVKFKFLLLKYSTALMCGVCFSISVPSIASDEPYAPIPPIKLKINKAQTAEKPILENYATYNEFLYAMYLYERSISEEVTPEIMINLPYKAQKTPEASYFDVGDDPDVTNWGDTIPQKK